MNQDRESTLGKTESTLGKTESTLGKRDKGELGISPPSSSAIQDLYKELNNVTPTQAKDQDQDQSKFQEGLSVYYKMKTDYEDKIMQEKKTIIASELSWKEKRRKFKMLKPKCIHCNRIGGTLFSMTYDDTTNGRKLMAKCGNRETPCPLNILIHLGNIYRVDETLLEDEHDLEGFKQQIIRDKNDLLFGYLSSNDALEKFDELKSMIQEVTHVYEYALEHYYLAKVENKETKKEIRDLQKEIPGLIQEIKAFVADFKNTNSMMDAVTVYIEGLRVKTERLRKLMYPVDYVEYNRDDNAFHLIQKPVNLYDLEQNLSDKWGVEKMVLTMIQKTLVRTTNNVTVKPARRPVKKTMKRRATVEPVEE